jgi:hypothetical protein
MKLMASRLRLHLMSLALDQIQKGKFIKKNLKKKRKSIRNNLEKEQLESLKADLRITRKFPKDIILQRIYYSKLCK